MQAHPRSPFELFGNPVRYVVPLYQRPYVWNLDEQWEPLWEDVRNVADQILDAGSPMAAAGVPPHFLGAIVLDQQWGPAGFLDVRHIIDGQQRLTTLQLLLDAAQLVVAEHGSEAEATALANLVLNNAAVAHAPEDVLKVWPTNYDRDAFRAAMDDRAVPNKDLAKHRVVQAHDYFREAILDWAEVTGDPDKSKARLAALTQALMRHLRLVAIDLEEGDNAQVIFESLNDRGTPLLAADLVKNRVFQAAAAEGQDVEQLYEEKWKPFDSEHWRRQISRGRLRRPRIDVFLYYWLAMRKMRIIAEDRLFVEFDGLLKSELNVGPIVDDFVHRAQVYEDLERFDPHSVEGTFTYRVLDTLDANILGPVLLWLFGWNEDDLPTDQRDKTLQALESWMVRRAVCRKTTKAFNKVMRDLLEVLNGEGPGSAGDATAGYLAAREGDSEEWPTDEEVRQAILEEPLYKRLKRARLRMVLEALEDDTRSSLTEEAHVPRGLTIEHVMPQGWREHWLLPASDEPEELATAHRDRLVHTLGNLTLVNNKLNPSLSNRPWLDADAISRGLGERGKRTLIDEHSGLKLNWVIAHEWTERWDEEAIRARGDALARRFCTIWPSAGAFTDAVTS